MNNIKYNCKDIDSDMDDVFLIQSSDGSHDGFVYENPKYNTAEEVILGGYYYFPCWEEPKYHGKEFAKIKPGDFIIHYCSSKVKQSPSMIQWVYRVIDVEDVPLNVCNDAIITGRCDPSCVQIERSLPRILRLKRVYQLRSPLPYKEIQVLVKKGVLSGNMKKCGQLGFNLCEVSQADIKYILNR